MELVLRSPIKHMKKIQDKLDKSRKSKLLQLCRDTGDGEYITQLFFFLLWQSPVERVQRDRDPV